MTDYITLTCPSCGGSLWITNDVERFACGYCGKENVAKRGGGIVTLAPVVEGLKRVQVGVDKTASELAISRLENEIKQWKNKIVDEKSKFDSAKFFKSSFGMAILIFMIIGGSTGDAGAGFWIAVVAFILMNIGHGMVESNHDKKNCEPIRIEIERRRAEIEKHKDIISS